ncbi:MAG: hypothetical protein HDT42_03120 [Ruminococcaceae bacterium]|nr:hypothetical protein [Oscillospiraceae bacterium]
MIQEFNKVDFMFLDDNLPDTLCLSIADHLDWSYPKEHLMILQEKLNKYVTFIINDGYKAHMSSQSFSRFNIIVCLKFQPAPIFLRFVKDYQAELRKNYANIDINYDLLQK